MIIQTRGHFPRLYPEHFNDSFVTEGVSVIIYLCIDYVFNFSKCGIGWLSSSFPR